MENKATKGQVLPFARSAGYLRRLAVKQRERGKLLQALELLRLSLQKEPENAETLLEMAGTYAKMQCPALSNRALFPLMKNEAVAAECFYGAGCNFYAMRMPAPARDCLVLYLQKQPDGRFSSEAVELIEAIDEMAEEEKQSQSEHSDRIGRALDALDAGKAKLAVRLMRRALSVARKSAGAHALLSFAHLSAGDARAALDSARTALKCDKQDLRALCAMAAALKKSCAGEAADAYLARAIDRMESDEDTQLVCQTACEMGEHACVRSVLKRTEADAPFADELLHLLATACYNAGDTEEAIRRWKLLRRINPMDSVAEYRLKMAEAGRLPAQISYLRQVPLSETLARLGRLRGWVQEGADALRNRFEEDAALESLLRWGLLSAEQGIPQAMIGVLTTLRGPRARDALQDLLCEIGYPDELKHNALAALCLMGVRGPFYALMGDRLTLVHVSRAEMDRQSPRIQSLLRLLRQRLGNLTDSEGQYLEALCRAAASQEGSWPPAFRARAIELAFGLGRGEKRMLPAKPAERRKLERFASRILKEAKGHEMHQL